MRGMKDLIKNKDDASVGVGTLILFIAMVLVAAVASSILVQTSNSLQIQAQRTGKETTAEVSSGLKVLDICGEYGTRVIDGTSHSGLHNLTITITPRAGSKNIDLSETLLIITNGTTEHVLRTNSTIPVIANDSSSASIFEKTPQDHPQYSTVFDLPSTEFGIIIVTDFDNTCTATTPGINKGDKVMLTVNLTALFNGVSERTQIWGRIVPEEGGSGIFDFTTPVGFTDTIVDLH